MGVGVRENDQLKNNLIFLASTSLFPSTGPHQCFQDEKTSEFDSGESHLLCLSARKYKTKPPPKEVSLKTLGIIHFGTYVSFH